MHSFQYAPDYTLIYMEPFIHLHVHTQYSLLDGQASIDALIDKAYKDGMRAIAVTDHGEGISQEDIPYIWDRYYKLDKNHKRAQIGTGLGLSIVRGVMELHNGKYGVISDVGRGSTFWFELNIFQENEQ